MQQQASLREERVAEFKALSKSRHDVRRMLQDYAACKSVCESLGTRAPLCLALLDAHMLADRKAGIEDNPLWFTPEVRAECQESPRSSCCVCCFITQAKGTGSDPSVEEVFHAHVLHYSERWLSQEEVDVEKAAQSLTELLTHCRTKHTYCFFCAIKVRAASNSVHLLHLTDLHAVRRRRRPCFQLPGAVPRRPRGIRFERLARRHRGGPALVVVQARLKNA